MTRGLMSEFNEAEAEAPEGYEHPDVEEDEGDVVEEVRPRYRKSACPKNDTGHTPVLNQTTGTYLCVHCAKSKWTGSELEGIADTLLREDSNAELCRVCLDLAKKDDKPAHVVCLDRVKKELPYGRETGHIEWQIQKDKEGTILLDEEDNALYVGFPELMCTEGHRWYKGEGPRRNINGINPILFETHLYNRKRREIQVKEGVPDPAYTMDRWNKRPTPGMYYRVHPLGRKVNTKEQRARNGASYYR